MNWSLDVGAVARRLRRLWQISLDQAPVLLPTAFVVFVFTAILATALAALACALTLIAVVVWLAWAWSPE
jgi:hypothetical protein